MIPVKHGFAVRSFAKNVTTGKVHIIRTRYVIVLTRLIAGEGGETNLPGTAMYHTSITVR